LVEPAAGGQEGVFRTASHGEVWEDFLAETGFFEPSGRIVIGTWKGVEASKKEIKFVMKYLLLRSRVWEVENL
jgi:hypothetical protein